LKKDNKRLEKKEGVREVIINTLKGRKGKKKYKSIKDRRRDGC